MSAAPYREFVSADQLEELTGYKRFAEQERALRAMGLVPFRGRNGAPKVTWEAINRIMAGERAKGRKTAEPDFGAI